MNIKKLLIHLHILIGFSLSVVAQEATISTNKKSYKYDERIELSFDINAKIDSIKLPDLTGFKKVMGPNQSSSTSMINGKSTFHNSYKFVLRPIKSGQFSIPSPIFYINNDVITAEPIQFVVEESNLTEEEINEKLFIEFIEDRYKPFGTIRYVVSEKKGFIEEFTQEGWKVKRRLSEDEISNLPQ